MKFTKDDARQELTSKIPNKGQTLNLSERSINEQLDALIPLLADDDTELSDFVEKVLPLFRTADGNVKNDVSVGIKNYKEKNPVAKTTATTEVEKEEEDAIPTDALLKRIEELEKRNADNEKKSVISQRRSDIVSKMSDKGCKDKEWVNELLDEVSLDGDEFDADARVEKYMKMYNKTQAKVTPDVTPQKPKGTVSDAYLNDIIKAAGDKNKVVFGAMTNE